MSTPKLERAVDLPPKPSDANQYLAMGAGIGVYGAVTAAVGAAVCPICVVATPALLGVGLYKKWRQRKGGTP